MRRMTTFGGLASLLVLAAALPVGACGAGMLSPVARFATADCVVVGHVLVLEGKAQELLPTAGAGQKSEYRIAVLRIDQALKGATGLTHVRVALLPQQLMNVGFEGCFFLTQHFEEPLYLYGGTYDYPIGKANEPAFAQEMARYRRWGKLLDDPDAGLGSKDADERLLTAALLISRYRSFKRGVHRADRKAAPIDVDESRRILEVLAEADWDKAGPDFDLAPLQLFVMLGVRPADGWAPRSFKGAKEYHAAAKQWVREHKDTFWIQEFVRG